MDENNLAKDTSMITMVKMFVVIIILSVGLLCVVNSEEKTPEITSDVIITYSMAEYKCTASEVIQEKNITTGITTDLYKSNIYRINDKNKTIITVDQQLTPGLKYTRITAKLKIKSENRDYEIIKYSAYLQNNTELTENIELEKTNLETLCMEDMKNLNMQSGINSEQKAIFNLLGLGSIVTAVIVLIRTIILNISEQKLTKAELKKPDAKKSNISDNSKDNTERR